MKNVIFVHCGNMLIDKYGSPAPLRCQSILDEMVDYMKRSGISNAIDAIYVEVVGDNAEVRFDMPNTYINYNGPASLWEFPTLNKLHAFANQNPECNILYLHTKGSSVCTNGHFAEYADDIRRYHLYWTVTNYMTCLDALKEYDVVGAELVYEPVRHFSHNMWWARASHINKLQLPQTYPLVFDERHKAEFWVGQDDTSTYHSVYNLYQSYVDAVDFSKELYEGISHE